MPFRYPGSKPKVPPASLEDLWDKLIDAIIVAPFAWLLALILGGDAEDWDTLDEIRDNLLPAIVRRVLGPLGAFISTGSHPEIDRGLGTTLNPIRTAATGVADIIAGIISGRNGGSSGNAAVREVIAEYHGRITALEGGGVRTQYTTNFTWANPTPTERKKVGVLCINAGRNSNGYFGGEGGGYSYAEFWTDELPTTVACTIGASNGATTRFGSYHQGYVGLGGVMDGEGRLLATSGAPGRGGDWTDQANPGTSSAFAAAPRTAGPGTAAPPNIPSGGSGAWARAAGFASGYVGGFPGGGGGANSNSTGSPGPGAPGAMFITLF